MAKSINASNFGKRGNIWYHPVQLFAPLPHPYSSNRPPGGCLSCLPPPTAREKTAMTRKPAASQPRNKNMQPFFIASLEDARTRPSRSPNRKLKKKRPSGYIVTDAALKLKNFSKKTPPFVSNIFHFFYHHSQFPPLRLTFCHNFFTTPSLTGRESQISFPLTNGGSCSSANGSSSPLLPQMASK